MTEPICSHPSLIPASSPAWSQEFSKTRWKQHLNACCWCTKWIKINTCNPENHFTNDWKRWPAYSCQSGDFGYAVSFRDIDSKGRWELPAGQCHINQAIYDFFLFFFKFFHPFAQRKNIFFPSIKPPRRWHIGLLSFHLPRGTENGFLPHRHHQREEPLIIMMFLSYDARRAVLHNSLHVLEMPRIVRNSSEINCVN